MTPIVVENGTGVTGANSYISAADADALLDIEGNAAWVAATLPERERLLQLASRYIDEQVSYIGTKRLTTTQGLDYPTDSYSVEDFKLLQWAVVLLAVDILTGVYGESRSDIQSISLPNFSVTTRTNSYARFTSRVDRILSLITRTGFGVGHLISRV